jgi:hypothetical protein
MCFSEFQDSILLINVHHSSSKFKRTFMLMIKRVKGVELGKSFIYYISSK